jgi:broad-specificity NMP kinase
MKKIIVTGTPGTGKTTLAKKLSKKLKYAYIDVNNVIKENKLKEGYDRICGDHKKIIPRDKYGYI